MSRITNAQQGMIGQMLFSVAAMIGSCGVLKAGFPAVDDEGRDVEVHLGGKFVSALAIQVKTSVVLRVLYKSPILRVRFPIPPENMIDHPLYWYFFAHLDLKQMRFSDPVFLVPSSEVNAHCHGWQNGRPLFTFQGSMAPNAHDRWRKYRLDATEVGKRLVEIMRQVPKEQRLGPTALGRLPSLSGMCRLSMERAG